MSEEFTPSVSEQVNPGPTLEQQAADMGISVDGVAPSSAPAPAPEVGTASDLILGKFDSQDALAEAYQSLEQRLGQSNSDMSVPLTQASEYFAQHGSLSDEHYASLDRAGLNRSIVDSYIDARSAQTEQSVTSYYERVGGEENYQAMGGWMQSYLPETEIEAYNRVMEAGTDDEVGVLMSGMYARYQAAMNTNYQQLHGQTTADAPRGFASRGQVMEALNDPRYESDESFRADFESKLAMTPEDVF